MERDRDRIPERPELVKVLVELPPDDASGGSCEGLWALPAGGNRYRLQNVPLLAYDLAYDDTVTAMPGADGSLVMTGVASRGGHSTYRVLVSDSEGLLLFEGYWQRLAHLGCGFERGTSRLLALNVPPRADIYAVRAILEEAETDGVWEFEEAFMGHRPS